MKTLLLIILFLLFCTPVVQAHPPSKVELSYDQAEEVLTIDIQHLTRDLNDHYIRRIEVQHKENDPQVIYLNRQPDKNRFQQKVDLKAEAEDTVKVKINCIKGGVKTAQLVIPPQAEDDDKEKAKEENTEQKESE